MWEIKTIPNDFDGTLHIKGEWEPFAVRQGKVWLRRQDTATVPMTKIENPDMNPWTESPHVKGSHEYYFHGERLTDDIVYLIMSDAFKEVAVYLRGHYLLPGPLVNDLEKGKLPK